MEKRNEMVVWAPTGAQMNEIRRRVSKERSKAAVDLVNAVRSIFRSASATNEDKQSSPAGCAQGV